MHSTSAAPDIVDGEPYPPVTEGVDEALGHLVALDHGHLGELQDDPSRVEVGQYVVIGNTRLDFPLDDGSRHDSDGNRER